MSKQKEAAHRCLTFALTAIFATACSGNLTHDEAKAIIEQNRLIRATDKVSVDAISATGSAEAIVRATIVEHTTNLKFRRFDNGWTWEFVETKSGGWIAPDVAMGQMREEVRTAAAAAWAEQHKSAYTATAQTIYYIALYNALTPGELQHPDVARKARQLMVESFKKRPEMQDRLIVLTNDHLKDAWSSDIETQFADDTITTVIRSLGPDQIRATEDDLLCVVAFKRGYESRAWTLPEDLGAAVQPHIRDTTDRIEFTRVVKP